MSCTLTQTADVNAQNCMVKSKCSSPSSVYQLENKLLDQQALFSESGLFCLFKNKKVLKWKGNFLNWMGPFKQKIKHFFYKKIVLTEKLLCTKWKFDKIKKN